MALLDAEYQYVGINENGHSSVSLVDLFAADAFKREGGQIGRKAFGPCLKCCRFLNASQHPRTVCFWRSGFVFKKTLNVAFK